MPRDGLVRVQTPQAFRFDAIRRAHAAWTGGEATDDAQVGARRRPVGRHRRRRPGAREAHLRGGFRCAPRRRLLSPRVGFGFDVHAFAAGRELWLGGVRIPHDKGLAGHSDADVVLHALTDAILGALGAGDIGDHFPPSDPQWRGAASSLFLEHARGLVEQAGGRIDACRRHDHLRGAADRPVSGRDARRGSRLCCGCRDARISIKATTTERLGFTGRGEGIAAQAVATLRLPEDR